MPDQITYSGVHLRLIRRRGHASEYLCSCGERAAEWAYTHDDPCPHEMVSERGNRYSADMARYIPMCRRCHRIYDKSSIQNCPAGHPYEGDNLVMDQGKRKCRTCINAGQRRRRKRPTPEQQARRNELQRIRRARAREARSS